MTTGESWCTWVSLGLTFFKQSLCGSASKDNNSTKEVPEMHFFQKGLVICMSSFTLRLFSSPGEAVSCPCFQSDTRMSYLSEATGHWPAAVQPEIRSQMTSLKPNTQTRTNCVWILSRLWEIVKVCSQAFHSGNTSSACPLSREKARLKCVYAHLCVLLCICFSWSTKDSKGWKASPPDP